MVGACGVWVSFSFGTVRILGRGWENKEEEMR